MDFYDAVNRRRTSRQWLDRDVDSAALERILDAGNKAPTWDHHRSWHYIILRTAEEKEAAFAHVRKIADRFDAERYLNVPRPYPVTLGQKMYAHAMPRQYSMLHDAPCVVENILLAAAAEGLSCSMRIPLNEEHDIVKRALKVPPTYMMPAFIGIGHPDPAEPVLEQYRPELAKQLHFGAWK